MRNGFLLIDKPEGMSSAHAVGLIKRQLPRKNKVGHGGTLDPLASGLLPIGIGEGTKLLSLCLQGSKAYEFTIRFGQATTTDDREGEVVETSSHRPDDDAIALILKQFTGIIQQIPPAYSALKVDGKRAYALAREGGEVHLPARPVEILSLHLTARADPDHATFYVECGKGTYVRSLARDIARALGSCGHVSMLRRVKVGKFSVDSAFLLAEGHENVHNAAALEHCLPVEAALDDIPALDLTWQDARKLRHGQAIAPRPLKVEVMKALSAGQPVAALYEGQLVALMKAGPQEVLKPDRVFNHTHIKE